MGLDRLPVDLDHLKVVDVDVERVPVLTSVEQPPFFRRAELDGLIDPVLIKLAAIDENPKRGELLREGELAAPIDRRSTQILEGDQRRGQWLSGHVRSGAHQRSDREVRLRLKLQIGSPWQGVERIDALWSALDQHVDPLTGCQKHLVTAPGF